MNNTIKLLETNPIDNYNRLILKENKVWFVSDEDVFSGETIKRIISFCNAVRKKYRGIKIPIVFQFTKDIAIGDKLAYVIFESICYTLMNEYGQLVYLFWNPKDNILTDGVYSSPLKLLNAANRNSASKFLVQYKRDLYFKHYRKIILCRDRETNYLGNLLQEIDSFLKFFSIEEEYREQISEVISELVGNACEHAEADCLLDIDVTDDHSKRSDETGDMFYGVNISILNYSGVLLGDGIKEKINLGNMSGDRYEKLQKAYDFHKEKFDKKYSFSDFCILASLQDKISGREEYNHVGGTGLTKLIHSLQEKSDMDQCYVLSGKRIIFFHRNLIEYDKDDWLGFNKQNDWFNEIPDGDVLGVCDIYFPGTAYNLNFVLKREVNDNENN